MVFVLVLVSCTPVGIIEGCSSRERVSEVGTFVCVHVVIEHGGESPGESLGTEAHVGRSDEVDTECESLGVCTAADVMYFPVMSVSGNTWVVLSVAGV